MRILPALCMMLLAAGCALPAAGAERATNRASAAEASVHRFIVKYRPETRAGRETAAVAAQVNRIASQAGLEDGTGAPLLRWERRLGVGADVVVSSRPLDAEAAQRLLQALNDDPDVEYAEPDGMMRRGPGPDVRGPEIRGD